VTPERNSSPRLRTTCRNATGPRTRTSVGRRGGPSVHNRRAAASRDIRWTYGQPGGWGLSYTATTRTAGSSARRPERSSGSLVSTTQRAEPCRSFAARAVAATSASTVASEAAFHTSRPARWRLLWIRLRHRGPAGRSGRAGYDLVVGPWPQSADLLHPLVSYRTVHCAHLCQQVGQGVPTKLAADRLVDVGGHAARLTITNCDSPDDVLLHVILYSFAQGGLCR